MDDVFSGFSSEGEEEEENASDLTGLHNISGDE